GMLLVLVDIHANPRHAGSIHFGKIVPVVHGKLVPDLDLAAFMCKKSTVHYPEDLDSRDGPDAFDNNLFVILVLRIHRDVANDFTPLHAYDVHRAEIAAGA